MSATVRPQNAAEMPPLLGQAAGALEEFVRAAKQTKQYPAYHPVMAAALERAHKALLKLFPAEDAEPIRLTTSREGLRFNGEALPTHGSGAAWMNRELRLRSVKTLTLRPGLQTSEMECLLQLLATDSQEIHDKGGAAEWLSSRGVRCVEVEQQEYRRLLRESEAALMQISSDEEAGGVKQVVRLCMGVLEGIGEPAQETSETVNETPAANEADDNRHGLPPRINWLLDSLSAISSVGGKKASQEEESQSLSLGWESLLEAEIPPSDMLATSLGNLIQVSYESLGEVEQTSSESDIATRAEKLKAWEKSLWEVLSSLEAELRARLFRVPVVVSPGFGDALGRLAVAFPPERLVEDIVLAHPVKVEEETSSALSRLFQRIMSTTKRRAEIEPILKERLLAQGMTEEIYRNVVWLLLDNMEKQDFSSEEMPLRIKDSEAGSLGDFAPIEMDDLLETLEQEVIELAHSEMLLDLLSHECSPSEYASLCAELGSWSRHWQEKDNEELALELLGALMQQTQDKENSTSYRVIAASALGRLETPEFVGWLAHHFLSATVEKRSQLLEALVRLGENAGNALLKIVFNHADEKLVLEAAVAMCDAEESKVVLPAPSKGTTGGANQAGRLLRLLSDAMVSTEADQVIRLARLLIAARCSQAKRALLFALRHREERVRLAIVQALSETSFPGADDVFLAALQDAHWEVKLRALHGLFKAAAELSKERKKEIAAQLETIALEDSLNPRSVALRVAAIEALGRLGLAESVELLGEFMGLRGWFFGKSRDRLRIAAARALGEIPDPTAGQILAAGAKSERGGVATACEKALGHWEKCNRSRGTSTEDTEESVALSEKSAGE